MKNISRNGLNLIKNFEGLRLKAYKCPAGVLTIGYGHTKNVNVNDVITLEQANLYLLQDLKGTIFCVNEYDKIYNFTQNEFDALCSFTFNCGKGNLNKLISARKKVFQGERPLWEYSCLPASWEFSAPSPSVRSPLSESLATASSISVTSSARTTLWSSEPCCSRFSPAGR